MDLYLKSNIIRRMSHCVWREATVISLVRDYTSFVILVWTSWGAYEDHRDSVEVEWRDVLSQDLANVELALDRAVLKEEHMVSEYTTDRQ
ncbi:hypothetical protein Tco_1315344 [Tanacetum coccineum]